MIILLKAKVVMEVEIGEFNDLICSVSNLSGLVAGGWRSV
jgi:hypothetical protein